MTFEEAKQRADYSFTLNGIEGSDPRDQKELDGGYGRRQ